MTSEREEKPNKYGAFTHFSETEREFRERAEREPFSAQILYFKNFTPELYKLFHTRNYTKISQTIAEL